jgi:hypothetical protein
MITTSQVLRFMVSIVLALRGAAPACDPKWAPGLADGPR